MVAIVIGKAVLVDPGTLSDGAGGGVPRAAHHLGSIVHGTVGRSAVALEAALGGTPLGVYGRRAQSYPEHYK